MRYFVSGIGTEVGKTVASAFLQLKLDADYWKPVQAGDLDFGDRDRVMAYTGMAAERYHPERYRLRTPASPHLSARIDGLEIKLEDFQLPNTNGRPLIVEGAGGLLVPLNERHTILDLIAQLGLPVILVSRHYLGSLNHTLMSVEVLRGREIPLAGILYNGGPDAESRRIVERLSGAPTIAELPMLETVGRESLRSLVGSIATRQLGDHIG